MLPIIGFCGASNSGKTTLVCKVIKELVKMGLDVGVIKHHGHKNNTKMPDRLKDTDRLKLAGASKVALVEDKGISLSSFEPFPENDPTYFYLKYFYDKDIVLVEGFKKAPIPKIEVVGPGKKPIFPENGKLLALALREKNQNPQGYTVLDANNPQEVSEFLLSKVKPVGLQKKTHSAKITVDGVKLSLTPKQASLLHTHLKSLVHSLDSQLIADSIEVQIVH